MTVITELKQAEGEAMPNKRFINMRPAGNDTALFPGIPATLAERRRLNDAIMGIYPNIEQVGFVNLDPANTELMMAGGEFCGNATRSTAFLALDGKPGIIDIKVSGVQGTLKAGVTENGEAFAQMPVYEDPQRIQEDPTNPRNYTVSMEGIVHYMDFDMAQIEGLSEEEIKALGLSKIRERGHDKEIAAGHVFVRKNGDSYEIVPVVYVRDAGTEFLETACGSGTTALGLVLAKNSGAAISEVPITQPSGKDIKISVDYDGNRFGYAQIQGEVDKLVEGDIETDGEVNYAIENITTEAQLEGAFSDGLIKLYQDIFSQAPYFESFTNEQVIKIFSEYVKSGILFIARDGSSVIGFGAAVPISTVNDIESLLSDNNIDPATSWYMADLGVKEELRRNGLGKKLVQKRISFVPPDTTTIVMRTSVDN
ncbi:MAG: hypothetical protein US51_C0045G0005, partial [Microgenomates group bacterium GW2011_GWA2_37_6]